MTDSPRRRLSHLLQQPIAGFALLIAPLPAHSVMDLADLSIEELSQVTVTSVSRRAQPLSLTASAVQVITADDIRRSGATRIPEALRLASNLQVAQITSDSWAISARGFNSSLANKMLVMVDGRSVYSPLFAGTFWETIEVPLFDIDRIEVVSGPGGALWGANAVNGVINIITRSAADTQGFKVRGGAGDEVHALGSIRYGGAVGDALHYRAYAKYVDRDGVQLATGADAPNDWRIGQTGFRMDWRASQADTFTLQGDVNEADMEQAPRDAQSRARNVLARWSRALSEHSALQVQTYYDYTYRSFPGRYADQLETFDVELQHDFRAAERHHLVWGLTFRRIEDDFRNALFRLQPANVQQDRWGGFINDEIELVDDTWFFTVGAKLEDNEYTGTEWQPSAGVSWRYTPNALLWSRMSRAVRTPSRIDRHLDNRTSTPFTLGSAQFESEELLSHELGWKTPLPLNTQLSLAVYHSEYEDIRSFERVNPATPLPVITANGLHGDGHGAELTLDYRPNARWRVLLGYTYLDLDLQRDPGSTDASGGAIEARDWRHQGFLRGHLDFGRALELSGELRRIGSIESHRLPAYTELDLRLAWYITPAIELALVGRNLLDDTHAEFGPPGRMEIERAAYAQVTWAP